MNMIGSSFRLTNPSNPTGSSTRMFSSKAILETKPRVVEQTTFKRPNSLYEVLRVERNATPLEIKTAYRSLAKIYHPDALEFKQQDDQDFIEIHNAYATLSDPEARAVYDQKCRRKTGLYTNGFNTTRRWETDQCW
uniref:chaperone protein dnaJ 11, chloroplastic-like n=1 Tax=Erigeron canadensis TaxID=72917 RepID=UPI001CB8AAB2|nr:chaperone protein dnaJ 11, chloroplastic-like [Erigeron canadensis]